MKRPFASRRPIGPFVSTDKPDIDLPRITNIGPNSNTADEVGKLVFRGANLDYFNQYEFEDNQISGNKIQIWTMDSAAILKRYDIDLSFTDGYSRYFNSRASNTEAEQALIDEYRIGEEEINDFNVDTGTKSANLTRMMEDGLVANKLETHVTGGLSKSLGVSSSFGSGLQLDKTENIPLVLFLEKNRIPSRFIETEYTLEFMREHPAIAAAADSGSKMARFPLVNKDYELSDTYSRNVNVKTISDLDSYRNDYIDSRVSQGDNIIEWIEDPLENFTGLTSEKELFAYTKAIDLDSSMLGACCYARKSRIDTTDAIPDALGSLQSKTTYLHDMIKDKMESYEDRLVICVVESVPRVGADKVMESKFVHLFDGDNFTTSYREAVPFTSPLEF